MAHQHLFAGAGSFVRGSNGQIILKRALELHLIPLPVDPLRQIGCPP